MRRSYFRTNHLVTLHATLVHVICYLTEIVIVALVKSPCSEPDPPILLKYFFGKLQIGTPLPNSLLFDQYSNHTLTECHEMIARATRHAYMHDTEL